VSDVVLLTGATGFLGAQIARRLIERDGCTIVALVRGNSREAAERRLSRAWWDWPELARAIGTGVEVMCGDVSLRLLGLDEADYGGLVRRVTHVIHTAGDLRVNAPIDELRKTNVQGTAHVLEFARAVQRERGLARLSHVSTAYVCGGRRGAVPEDALTDAFGFSSAYELSKYEGERLVQAAKGDLPISVYRPGMIVGDSHTGEIKTFNTFYFPLRLYLAGTTRILPARPDLRANLVPVDYVADAIVHLTFEPEAAGLTFHLTAPHEYLPTAGELAAYVRDWAQARLGVKLARPIFIPLPEFLTRGRYRPERAAGSRRQGILDSILTLAPYFNERVRFQRDNADRLLGPYAFDWRAVLPPILEYAVRMGFMHRSERTVHEQILFRLGSRNRRITYHDIVEGSIITRHADEVRREMLRTVNALHVLGIERGDRVAIVGLNSTRYLSLDVAIGLTGAVSVPLYYTSPPAEIDAILQASGARLLFIGAPKLLERLGELQTDLPVISFCRETVPGDGVMPWESFLALEPVPSSAQPEDAGVGAVFGDIATLRYSSGTTGKPKGVIFNHEHLRWMGLCLPGLLPWQARNRAATYLSFLPLNHVVEGILATYSPYYVPAPVDIFYLEDIYALPRTLPRVRPSVFFSVPRVYEKVWARLQDNRLGQFYLALREGVLKRMLRPVLRRSLLRRSGFDRCAQLIVGSAPCGEGLIRSFRELGIELHNAYGLTEAPLVTLNRQGANRIGTVGRPLPETEIRVAGDGEVLVRGPQVTVGYLDEPDASPFRDGWLATGDLGRLTEEGDLLIVGRKKELIKTAYGKYAHPAAVEARLKEIPGVAEAMLVGEGMPFCVALMWIGGQQGAPQTEESVDHAVMAMNAGLSHPEQVKRWALLPYDLSVEGGDLTPNLKLKRQAVVRRFQGVVDSLYDGCAVAAPVLHVGVAGADARSIPRSGEESSSQAATPRVTLHP
jgi:long-chain acyl-CoA synthetase